MTKATGYASGPQIGLWPRLLLSVAGLNGPSQSPPNRGQEGSRQASGVAALLNACSNIGPKPKAPQGPIPLAPLASPPTIFFKVPSAPITFPFCTPRKGQASAYPDTLQVTAQSHVFSGLCSNVASSSRPSLAPFLRCYQTLHPPSGYRHLQPSSCCTFIHGICQQLIKVHIPLSILFAQWNGASRGPGPVCLALCLVWCLAHSGRSASPCCRSSGPAHSARVWPGWLN